MSVSSGLSHLALSVPEGTLTGEYRATLLEFYGRLLGWREMESLRLPDRLTVAVGSSSYINIRERPDSMVTHGYEHFGVFVRSADEFQRLWAELANEQIDIQLEPFSTNDHGEGSFRFRYLLPMAVEVQYYAVLEWCHPHPQSPLLRALPPYGRDGGHRRRQGDDQERQHDQGFRGSHRRLPQPVVERGS